MRELARVSHPRLIRPSYVESMSADPAWRFAAAVLLTGAFALLGVTIRHRSSADPPPRTETARAVPVVAAPARARAVGVYLTGLGTVTPLNTVTVKTQVSGKLMAVMFHEGQLVNEGDVSAQIDPRPFEAQLTQFKGQLARDQALLENAKVELQRYQVLYKQDSVPQQQLATQDSLVHQLEGTVQNDQGQIDAVTVQLDYCRIASPISGRVGLRLVDPGNFVQPTDAGGIVVITQLQPITVVFTIPEDSIPAVPDRLGRGVHMPVEAYDREQRRKLATGSLLTIDNQVDPTTGTVKLKAEFPNADSALFPSQFVNARLQLDVVRRATVVPAAAIQRAARAALVYVVNADQTVEARAVTVGVTAGYDVGGSQGGRGGERGGVGGADRLRDGIKVVVQPRSSP